MVLNPLSIIYYHIMSKIAPLIAKKALTLVQKALAFIRKEPSKSQKEPLFHRQKPSFQKLYAILVVVSRNVTTTYITTNSQKGIS